MWLFVLTVLGLEKEQWNGPEGAKRCDGLDDFWENEFDVGERAFMLQSQSYICAGVDCDGDGGFFAKYAWKCAAKGSGGVGSQDIQAPYVSYVITGSTAEFHSHKSCKFFEDIGEEGDWTTNVTGSCTVPKASECEYPDPPATHTKLPHIEKELNHWGGLLLNVDFNDAAYQDPNPHLHTAHWNALETISHGPIYGVEGTACENSGDYSNAGAERAFYNGGVMVTQTRGPVTTRLFMF